MRVSAMPLIFQPILGEGWRDYNSDHLIKDIFSCLFPLPNHTHVLCQLTYDRRLTMSENALVQVLSTDTLQQKNPFQSNINHEIVEYNLDLAFK